MLWHGANKGVKPLIKYVKETCSESSNIPFFSFSLHILLSHSEVGKADDQVRAESIETTVLYFYVDAGRPMGWLVMPRNLHQLLPDDGIVPPCSERH